MLENQLQPVAFLPKTTFAQSPIKLASLPFPAEWYRPLSMLADERWPNRAGKHTSPPVDSLNRSLSALVPHLLTAPQRPPAERDTVLADGHKPWLLSYSPIASDRIWMVVQAWLEKEFGQGAQLAQLKKLFDSKSLQWTSIGIPLNGPTHSNNTAAPTSLAWDVFPTWIADQLIQRGLKIQVYGESRSLVRVPVGRGAELMTWPPVLYHDNEREWPFSYTIRITLQTLWGSAVPHVHFHYGIRRWVSKPLVTSDGRIKLGQMGRSVYLRTTEPWLGLDATNSFSSTRLQARYESGSRVAGWDDTLADIAQRLNVPFPDASQLVENPESWIKGRHGVEAGIVEHTPRHHPINAGLGLEEHERITRQITGVLENELDLCGPLSRTTVGKTSKHGLNKDIRDVSVAERLGGLENSIGSNLTVRIFWDTEAGRDTLCDRLLATLCRPRPKLVDKPLAENAPAGTKPGRVREKEPPATTAPECQEIQLPSGGRLRIETQRIGELGALLPAPEKELRSSSDKGRYKREQTEKRVKQIRESIAVAKEPTLALIELPNYQDPRQSLGASVRMRDPKRALRLGFAHQRIITKFTTANNEDLIMRCEAAVRDGLRQMGYLTHPIGFKFTKGHSLPTELTVAGVSMLRLTTKRADKAVNLPVVVLFSTSRAEVRGWVPDGKGVRPYHQMLLDVTTIPPSQVSYTNRGERLKQLRNFLSNDIFAEGVNDLAILATAQNARSIWTGLQNPNAIIDCLSWTSEDIAPLDKLKGRVRLIRLRTYQSNETPEWYVQGAEPGQGFLQGVWNLPEHPRTFYNNASKSKSMAKKFRGKQVDPREHYSLPSLLEICAVALQDGDNPVTWALAVDQWRRMSNVTNDMTLLPIQLEFARKVDKYGAVIGPWIFPKEWESEDDDIDESDEEGDDTE